jgi:hypothetical protein
MSTTLFFLVPIGMLAVVWSVCFVGCVLQTSGIAEPYSNNILQESTLVAYWPLSDFPNSPPPAGAPALPPPPQGSTGLGTALDISGKGHNGSYLQPPTYPALQQSTALNPPTLTLRQGSIVPGDAFTTGSKNLPACVNFDGGYVSIPWSTQNPQDLSQFTLEAWIQTGWPGSGAYWVVFCGLVNHRGFSFYVNPANHWEIAVGTGGTSPNPTFDTMVPIVPGSTTYVAVTCDKNGNMSLWINPSSDSDSNTPPPPSANWTSPMPTGYMQVDTTQPVTFFIGAGDCAEAPRTQDLGSGAPAYPFKGLIQSVALYNSVLDPTDLASHFENGAETG